MLSGVILDIDGTLILSNDAHAQSWVDALHEFGYDVPFDRIKPLIGMGGDKLLPAVAPGLSDEEGIGKEISSRRGEIFKERYAGTLKAAPGTRDLLLRMKRDHLDLAIASSAKDNELDRLLEVANVQDLISEATTSDDAEQSKPDPDIVKVALDRLGKNPAEVVMLGDTQYDIEAAAKAGIKTIAMRCGGHSDDDLRDAIAIYDDPADLASHYDESPLRP